MIMTMLIVLQINSLFYDIKTEQKHWRLVILDVQNQI